LTFTRVVEESVCTPGVDVAVLRAAGSEKMKTFGVFVEGLIPPCPPPP
jgi:hypothetical protein